MKRELQAFTKVSDLNPIQKQHLSELSVGKIFNCTPSWSCGDVPAFLGGFYIQRQILKGILKEKTRDFGKFWRDCNKIKIGLTLFLFSKSGLGQKIFAEFPILCFAGFKAREY